MKDLTEGRIVHYVLTAADADAVNRRRTNNADIQDRLKSGVWPVGAQAHIGNPARPGQHLPMMVTLIAQVVLGTVNGQVTLDGNDQLWVTNVSYDPAGTPGTWHWSHVETGGGA